MKKILFIILLISSNLSAQIWTDTIPDWDHTNIANIKIQYSGDWAHMKAKPGSYPRSNDATALYKGWMQRIDIYTEIAPHHTFYIINRNGVDIDTIYVSGPYQKSVKTASLQLPYRGEWFRWNHNIELRGGLFVLDYLVKFVDSNPNPPVDPIPPVDCIPDTVYVPKPYPVYDTVYLQPKYYFLPDSLAFEIK